MPIPSKIENDGLLNAVVYLSFKTDYNESFIDSKLSDFFGTQTEDWQKVEAPNAGKTVGGVKVPVRFFANRIYKIQVSDTEIAFNFNDRYPGWDAYRRLIERVVGVLNGIITIKSIVVNYVSTFKNIRIFDYIDGEIKLNNLPQFFGTQYNFRCQVHNERGHEANAILSLTNEEPIQGSFTEGIQDTQSIVNIKVSGEPSGDYLEYLNFLHETEKDLFYRIVNQEFVDSHNPTYK